MSIVCKQLVRHSDRVLSCCRPTMIMSPLNTASPSWNKKPSSNLPSIIREVEGDLFTAKRDTSMAHCVSSDMKMGAGIAVYFRLKFGRVDELLSQKKDVGQVAYLKDSQRFIFYLVTKKRFYDKPTEGTLHASLVDMREKCEKLGVTKLAMPRIGCGLDGLKWPMVFHLVQEVFQNCGMEITIYSVPDKKRKSMTPNLNRVQGDLRKFFEPKRPNSLPASAMNSKRKYHSDSSEEYLDTPKRRKIISHGRNFLLDGEADCGKVSFHGRNAAAIESDSHSPVKKKLSSDRRVETKLSVNYKEAAMDDTSDKALGNCPFSPSTSTKKRNSLPNPQLNYSFDSNQHEASILPGIPFLCEDQGERNRMQQIPRSELECSMSPYQISEKESKYSHNSDKFSSPIKEARQTSFNSSDQEEEKEEVSEEKVKTPSKSSRKEKRRSSKSRTEEKVKKGKRRSSSKSRSEEKVKKEKRRSSSKSRSEEKVKKEKRRSSSKSRSEEKCREVKRRSSSKSEEKLKKTKQRSSDSFVRQPLGHSESSQSKVNLVSERFPSFNKKRLSRDLSSSSDESDVIKPSCLNNQGEDIVHPQCKLSLDHSRGEEDTMQETKRKRLASPKQVYCTRQLNWASRSLDETNDTDIDLPSNEPRGRLGEFVKIPHRNVDDSLDKKVKKPVDESFGTPRKTPRKALKSPIGKMYCDKEANHVSVKARLSLDHKL